MSRSHGAFFMVLALGLVGPAMAQSVQSADQAATRAIEKGQEGIVLYERGEWLAALERFQQADALYHSPVLSLFMARSLRSSGQFLAAKIAFERVASEPLPSEAPDIWRNAQSDARAELAALERAIPRVAIALRGASPSVQLTLDGKGITAGQGRPVDPGSHEVVARDGARREVKIVTVGPSSGELRVVMDLTPAALGPSHKLFTAGLIATGVGGAGLIAAGVTGFLARQQTSDVRRDVLPKYCSGDRCPRSRREEIEAHLATARRFDTSASILFWGGLATGAVGVTLMLFDRRQAPALRASGAMGSGVVEVRF